MMRLQYLMLLLAPLFYTFKAAAQHPIYKTIGINEGLPSSTTFFVLNDKNGYIWIASDLGLSKYDGRKIKNITPDNGIINTSVICLDTDAEGRLFLITEDGSLGFIRNDTIIKLRASQQFQTLIGKNHSYITAFKVDSKANIWVATSLSLYHCDKDDDYTTIKEVKNENKEAYAIVKDLGDKSIASSHDGKVTKLKIKEGVAYLNILFDVNSVKESKNISCQTKEGINTRFASFKNKEGKIFFSNLNNLYSYNNKALSTIATLPNSVLYIFEDSYKNLFVSLSNDGGVLFFKHGNLNRAPDTLFKGSTVGSICQDFENGIWLSSTGNGVYYIPYVFSSYYPQHKELNNPIAAVESIDSAIFVAGHNHEIVTISQNDKINKSKPLASVLNIGKVSIRKLNNSFYYCGNVIAIFDPKTLEFKYIFENKLTLASTSIDANSSNEIYLLSYARLLKIKEGTPEFVTKLEQRSNQIIFVEDSLIIGTRKGIYTLKENQVEKVEIPILEDANITSLTYTRNHQLLIGTKNKGIFIFSADKPPVNLNTSNGLISNYCSHISVDEMERIWIATNKGLCYFDGKNSNKVFVLNKSNGLNNNEIIASCVCKDQLFLATKLGLIKYDLRQLNFMEVAPKINLESVLINGFNKSDTLLSYNKNNLKFVINCISYKELGAQIYAYQLIGFDKDVKTTSNEYIEYSNLPAGRYTLMLAGVDAAGNHLQLEKFYSFEVKAPFWQSWWFYLLSVFVVVSLIYLVIRWRVNLNQRKIIEKAEIERLISESKITAIRAQMNPHFIFNSISSIQDFVLKNETQNAYDYLSKFAKLIRLVLNNSKENYITLERELEWLRIYINLEQLRFKNAFEYELKIDDSVEISDLKIPTMLLQPYIENAIWHGITPLENKRRGSLLLQIVTENDLLKITIEDNGVGRKHSESVKDKNVHISMGMTLVSDKLGALMKLSNNEINVQVIDLYNGNEPTGTRVEIIIKS